MEQHVGFSTWTSSEASAHSDAVGQSLQEMNEMSSDVLYDYLESTVNVDEQSGLIYSRIGSESDSKESVIAISSPYANGLEPHRLALSALHYEVGRRAGFRDGDGNTVSVVTIGSPTINNRLEIDSTDKQNMLEGLAKRELELLERQKIGRVALFGFSQGADVSMVAATEARDIEIAHVAVGDPVRGAERNRITLMQDMTKVSIPEVKGHMREGGLEFQLESYEKHGKIGNFLLSSAMPTNILYMTKALGRDELSEASLQIAGKTSLAVAYGSESAISQEKDMQRARQNIDAAYDAESMAAIDMVRMEGKNHAWGDNASLLSGFYFDKMPKSI